MMSATNTPGVLWDDGLQYYSAVRCHTVNSTHETQGEVPQTIITGEQSDISCLAEFSWYTYVWYMSPEDTSMERKKLGKYCGPFFNEGDAMSAKIMTSKATQVNRTSVFRVTAEEAKSQQFQKLATDFEASLKERLKKGWNCLKSRRNSLMALIQVMCIGRRALPMTHMKTTANPNTQTKQRSQCQNWKKLMKSSMKHMTDT